MQAASRLARVGTKQAEAERLLGEPTRRERWHGPSVTIQWAKSGESSTPAGYHNSWHDIYDFENGEHIDVSFDIESSPFKWEDRTLTCISMRDFAGFNEQRFWNEFARLRAKHPDLQHYRSLFQNTLTESQTGRWPTDEEQRKRDAERSG
jgi:hypothetical protein